jgi:hypothetical protein
MNVTGSHISWVIQSEVFRVIGHAPLRWIAWWSVIGGLAEQRVVRERVVTAGY